MKLGTHFRRAVALLAGLLVLTTCLRLNDDAVDAAADRKKHRVRSILGSASNCRRLEPDNGETRANKSAGTNGFKILVRAHPRPTTQDNNNSPAGDLEPAGYVPGEYYTVVLEGWRTLYTVQTFRGFALAALSANSTNLDQPLGSFQVKDTDLIRWSPQCYHVISHSSLQPKTHIEAVWQAPSLPGAGCVNFRAMILEYKDLWYADDGLLTKKFCPIENDQTADNVHLPEQCCACDEAKYEMIVTGYWSKETHPKDFPTLEHLTHFSDVVGASHSDRYAMWAEGTYATDGMKQLAEWGDTTKYEEELKEKGREVRTLIKAKGLWYPNVQGTTKAIFTTDKYHHLLSAASMLGPTPDWIVGVSSYDLCLKNCTWLQEASFDLVPWDAGTDSGVTYMAPNTPTVPKEKIRPLTTRDDPRSPFYNPSSDKIKSLGKLVLRKQKTIPMECKDISEYAQASDKTSGSETSEDLEYKDRRECMVAEWTPWSLCSASCGKGLRMRSRQYKNAAKARMGECKRQINEKQFCNAEISVCAGSEAFNDMCVTSDWGEWTDCTVTCGKGLRSRSRNYNNPMAMKKCDAELMQKEMCMGQAGPDCNIRIDPNCRTTFWSEWSPCSQSCGDGSRVRTRLFFYPEKRDICQNTELMERSSCNVQNCEIFLIRHAQEICQQPLEAGSCQGIFPRYFYDSASKTCRRFVYTGCRGNKNNFESETHCRTACMRSKNGGDVDDLDFQVPAESLTGHGAGAGDDGGPAIHCMVTEWSLWSECTSTCNSGHKQRTRMVKVPAKNGGHPCPRDLIQKARCRLRPCPTDCRMTQWTDWSTCSAPCGLQGSATGYQMRMRRGRSYAKVVQAGARRGSSVAAASSCPLTQVDKRVCQSEAC